jgi:hypothetical protein
MLVDPGMLTDALGAGLMLFIYCRQRLRVGREAERDHAGAA